MNLEITGKLVEKYDTQNVNERFRKREFVIEVTEEVNGSAFTNFAKMQLVQNKTDIIDRFNIGETLRVNFSIKGNRYERDGKISYFSNLDAWRIEKADMAAGNNGGGANYNNAGNQNQNFNYGAGGNNNNNGGGSNNNWNNNGNNNGGGNWNNGGNNNNPGDSAPAYQQNNAGNFAGGSAAESADDLPF